MAADNFITRNLGQKDYEYIGKWGKRLLIGGVLVNFLAPGIGAWYTIAPGEAGVVKRGGKYHHTTYNIGAGDSGLHFKVPELLLGMLPGDEVMKTSMSYPHRVLIGIREVKEGDGFFSGDVDISKPVKYETIPENEMERMITKDVTGFVYPNYVIQYLVENPEKYFFNFKDPDTLLLAVQLAEMRANMAVTEQDDTMTIKRAEIGRNVKEKLQEVAGLYDLGIKITVGEVQDVKRSEIKMAVDFDGGGKLEQISVQDAYTRVAAAEKQRDALIKEGKIYEAGRLKLAEENREKSKIEGDTYYIKNVGTAIADTNRLIAYRDAFVKTRETSEKRLIIDTMADIVMNAKKVVIASDDGMNKIIFVPVESSGKDVSVNINTPNSVNSTSGK